MGILFKDIPCGPRSIQRPTVPPPSRPMAPPPPPPTSISRIAPSIPSNEDVPPPPPPPRSASRSVPTKEPHPLDRFKFTKIEDLPLPPSPMRGGRAY